MAGEEVVLGGILVGYCRFAAPAAVFAALEDAEPIVHMSIGGRCLQAMKRLTSYLILHKVRKYAT